MVSNKVLTLAFVRESARVLLGLKKRGFGQGRWNGFGGKVQPGETIEQGARRSVRGKHREVLCERHVFFVSACLMCLAHLVTESLCPRELEEECGLVAEELNPAGILIFEIGPDPQLLEVHVFTTQQYSGTIVESDGELLGCCCAYAPVV